MNDHSSLIYPAHAVAPIAALVITSPQEWKPGPPRWCEWCRRQTPHDRKADWSVVARCVLCEMQTIVE